MANEKLDYDYIRYDHTLVLKAYSGLDWKNYSMYYVAIFL